VACGRYETFGDDNYDGPDITYYFDEKDPSPGSGGSGDDGGDGERHVLKHMQQKQKTGKGFWAGPHPEF
jgi:hypothetical protein